MPTDLNRTVHFYRDKSLQDVEVRFSQYRETAFQKHFHDTYSVGIVTQGLTRLVFNDPEERTYDVGGEDIVLINPGQIHACNPHQGSVLTYFMFYVNPSLFSQLVSEITDNPDRHFVFNSPIVRDQALYRELVEVGEAIFSGVEPLEVETRLYEALSGIVVNFGALQLKPVSSDDIPQVVNQGFDYLISHLTEKVSLADLASASGLSKFHFLRAFRRQYGVPPHIYQLQQRINLARDLLASGRSIADVASETGFADQSHFTRKFKVLVGATPREYQLSAQSRNVSS